VTPKLGDTEQLGDLSLEGADRHQRAALDIKQPVANAVR
jgi:hypothetical protein